MKGLGELGYVRGEEKRMEGCVPLFPSHISQLVACLRESDKKWLHDNCLKLVDASTSQSIDRDAGDAGQSTRRSMSIACVTTSTGCMKWRP